MARATTTALLEATGVAADEAATLAGLAGGRPGWAVAAARDRSLIERQQASVDRGLAWIGASGYDRLVTALRIGDGFTKQREETYADLITVLGLWRDALLLLADRPDYVTYRVGVDTLSRWMPGWDLDDVSRAIRSVQTGIADLESNVRPRLALENMVLQWPTPDPNPTR